MRVLCSSIGCYTGCYDEGSLRFCLSLGVHDFRGFRLQGRVTETLNPQPESLFPKLYTLGFCG